MTITDLEEFEGLTVEMVRGYLGRTGWWQYETDATSDSWTRINNNDSPRLRMFNDGFNLGPRLTALAEFEKRSVQSLLREMNPRLRKGCPSTSDRSAHTGYWQPHASSKGGG